MTEYNGIDRKSLELSLLDANETVRTLTARERGYVAERERLITALNLVADETDCDDTHEFVNRVLVGK